MQKLLNHSQPWFGRRKFSKKLLDYSPILRFFLKNSLMPISKHVNRIKTGLKSLGKSFMLKLTLTIHLIC